MAAHSTDSQLVSEAYIISKIANNRMAELIHNDHHEKEGILAYAIHPGAVVTPQTEGHSNEKGDVWEQSALSLPSCHPACPNKQPTLTHI
jgi:NAD(P)-dependent dehydrogenase (short-subunit alcohol dehydrogenase family)